MILIIDNYDSFTYNLAQYISELYEPTIVYRSDKVAIEQIKKLKPKAIIISPGPGKPEDAGISINLVETLGPQIPILGICLGHQTIGQVFGAKISLAPILMHGKTSLIFHNKIGLFEDIENPFLATRYHSLIIENSNLPELLNITAWTSDGLIMGIEHTYYKHIQGIQFHPESILTEPGKQLLENFLKKYVI
uniref:Anthranilate synthase component 2 n=1 Tax=Glaucocystis incrassata TaxID=1789788 RepID=A0A3G1IVB7_9EUKA|nr:anthranilate synthase component II [Glaucocystis incrassata]ASQ39981.1 anthranilate synthase component II [Glaucocystis incrassata]